MDRNNQEKEFILLKKEELQYLDMISKLSFKRKLSSEEKIGVYRTLKEYETKVKLSCQQLLKSFRDEGMAIFEKMGEVMISFPVPRDYFSRCSSSSFDSFEFREMILKRLDIDSKTFFYQLKLSKLLKYCNPNLGYRSIEPEFILNQQKLFDKEIYVFCGYDDSSFEGGFPIILNEDDYLYGIYQDILEKQSEVKILKKDMPHFEVGKIIIQVKDNVNYYEIQAIFKTQLLDCQNKTVEDIVKKTQECISKLNFERSSSYKEKLLQEKVKRLCEKVKGDFLEEKMLYQGKFLSIVNEVYELPDKRMVEREMVIKNQGKNAVIVVALTEDNQYILTFQNRIQDKVILEFPSGYIEDGEEVVCAAKRELEEETGYVSNQLFIIDQAYSSLGTSSTVIFIVMANYCSLKKSPRTSGHEVLSYDLFSPEEVDYLVENNLIDGAMNKLAYYRLVNDFKDDFIYQGEKKCLVKVKKRNEKKGLANH